MNRRYRFRYIGVKNVVKELDGWIRRHLRKLVWRQWKRNYTRARNLMTPGDWKKDGYGTVRRTVAVLGGTQEHLI